MHVQKLFLKQKAWNHLMHQLSPDCQIVLQHFQTGSGAVNAGVEWMCY